MAVAFGRENRSRAVLAAIVADPAFGPSALSHPATLFSLLSEYLPDSPDETGPLLAAAQLDIPGVLRGHVADGMSRRAAIQLAAADLAARTSFPNRACLWAACEFALALGLATADQLPRSLSHGDVTAIGPARPTLVAGTGAGPPPAGGPRQRGPRGPRSGRSPRLRGWLVGIACAVAVAVGAAWIGLLPQPHVAGQRPYRGDSHGNPGTGIASAPGTADARPQSASAHPSVRTAASPRPSTASPRPSTASPAPGGPALIAMEYIAEVNEHDWPAVWQLGGGNVVLTYQPDPGPLTYPEMVAAFRDTVSVEITSLTPVGDTVSMHVSALDSAGVTQYYELSLVIGGGRIVSGRQYFLGS